MEDQALGMIRDQVGATGVGTIFLFIGLVACVLAGLRGCGRARLLLWQGIFSALYGARMLAQSSAAVSLTH